MHFPMPSFRLALLCALLSVQAASAAVPDTTITSGPSQTYRRGIVSFAFSSSKSGVTFECSLDGAAYAACKSPYARQVDNGAHHFAVRAKSTSGTDATPATRDWWADGLVQNGMFEASSDGWDADYDVPGWNGYQANVALEADTSASGHHAHVTATLAQEPFSVYTSPRVVNSAEAGSVWFARAKVRSDKPGGRVCLILRERDSAGVVGNDQHCLTTTSSWQEFTDVRHTVVKSGDQLEIVVSQSNGDPGDSFDLDAVEMDDVNGPVTVARPAAPAGDPVLLGVGDIASCWSSGDEGVARLLDGLGGTLGTSGDTAYDHGSAADFRGCFDPSWSRHLWRIKPAIGDHEYDTPGATGYWDYFGALAGPRSKGWYSYELGTWHVVVLNSNCDEVGGCGPDSDEGKWLAADLSANAHTCTLAYFQHPLFSAGLVHGSEEEPRPLWDALYQYGTDVIYNGDEHTYQRFAPQTPDGVADPNGIREFVVGTGGSGQYALGAPLPTTEVQHTGSYGVLRLVLHGGSYDWRFVAERGQSFSDSGSAACSTTTPSTPPPPTQPAVNEQLANGGFESGLTGWRGYHGSLSLAPSAVEGTQAAHVTFANDGATSYSVFQPEKPVGATTAGQIFTARGWVRSSTPGKRICLRIREGLADGTNANATSCQIATSTWTAIGPVRYIAVGGVSLDAYVYQDGAAAGDSFDADGLSLSGPA